MKGLKLFKGRVGHVRHAPRKHQFNYSILQFWLDVEKPELVDQISRWWSSRRTNLVRFNEQDYLPGDGSLHQRVCDTIACETGQQFSGKAYLLGSFRMWGYCYNPVSFIFCYQQDRLAFLISEVHNTPWGERFCYVHSTASEQGEGGVQVAKFKKAFHVSPFFPMDLQYVWKYRISESEFSINMALKDDSTTLFNANLQLHEVALTKQVANLVPWRFPFLCVRILFAIYWQALKLWLKRTPFYPYPKNLKSS